MKHLFSIAAALSILFCSCSETDREVKAAKDLTKRVIPEL